MKTIRFRTVFFCLLIIMITALPGFIKPENEKVISDFSLMNTDGKMVSLNDFPGAKGFIVVFTCNHCPFAKLYPPRLNRLYVRYSAMGVPLLAISSTDTLVYEEDTYPLMVNKAKEEKFNFPYLFDGLQTAAKDFGAQKTPHAFVIWKKHSEWIIEYSGAIDDNGAEPDQVKHRYVEEAVNSLLKGEPVLTKKTNSIGCQIKLRQ